MLKNLICVVLLATSVTSAYGFRFFRRKAYNIHKFLGVKQPIWTHTTSRRTDILCEVDVVINTTETSILFNRTSYDRKGRTSGVLRGEFNRRRKKHLLVHTEGGIYDLHEEMLYMSSDHSCGVIMVTRMFGGTFRSYDLRVRNSSVEKGPRKDCVRKFKRRDSRGQVIYRPLCQDLFQVKAPNALPTSTTKAPPVTVPRGWRVSHLSPYVSWDWGMYCFLCIFFFTYSWFTRFWEASVW